MWREYTRETPGRPGLALLMVSLAFGGSVWLAWSQTMARAAVPLIGDRQTWPDWPVSYELPTGLVPVQLPDPEIDAQEAAGWAGQVTYHSDEKAPVGIDRLSVLYHLFPPETTTEEAASYFLGHEVLPGAVVEMDIGPVAGKMIILGSNRGLISFAGVTCTPDGIAVMVRCDAVQPSPTTRRLFEAICKTIRFEPWSVRR